jgi:predicted phage terminase large subunit-like protein
VTTNNPNLRANEFIKELEAMAAAQRQLIEAEVDGFATDASAQDIRLTRVAADTGFRFFCYTYLPHYFKGEPSVFHDWVYAKLLPLILEPRGRWLNISAPRGEAKSTLVTQALVLYCVVRGLKHYIPIVMDTVDQATTMLEAIKVELTSNPRLSMDFPQSTGAGRVWNVGVSISTNNIKLQAFGSGKKMRGLRHGPHRPDLVILDDIENDEAVTNPAQRDKLNAWLKKVVLPLGPPDGSMDIVYLNTILHYDSVANRTHKNPLWVSQKFRAIVQWPARMDVWEQWERVFLSDGEQAADDFYAARKTDMDAGAQVSWPSMRGLLKLMKMRAADHHAFDCEYQNDPTNDDAAFFPKLHYWVQPSRDWVFYGVDDPSLGKHNKGRDPCAILVGGYDRLSGKLDIVEAMVARMVPDLQVHHIIELQRQYKCLVWGIESIQFQEYFRQQLIAQGAAKGVPIPAVAIMPHTDKQLRIQSLSPHVANGMIRFNHQHTALNEQLRHYPEAEHDDGPDALHMLWSMAMSRAGGVPLIVSGKAGGGLRGRTSSRKY